MLTPAALHSRDLKQPGRLLLDNAVLPPISWLAEMQDQNSIWDAIAKSLGLIGSSQWHYRGQVLCPIYVTLISATMYTFLPGFLSSHSSYKTSKASMSTFKCQDYWPSNRSTVWAFTTTQSPASSNCPNPNLMSWKR